MDTTVILADISSSMDIPVQGGRRRIDLLNRILKNVFVPGSGMHLIAFSDLVTPLKPGQSLPEPSGSTAMHLALEDVARLSPKRVIVISDGQPDDDKAAFTAARALSCVISTFYCGDESDRRAISFLKSLALCSRGGVGRPQLADLRKPEKLADELRLLLAAPSPS
jgi:hypothetical protein